MKFLLYILTILIIGYISVMERARSDFFVESLFVVIILYSLYNILRPNQPPYSLVKNFNIFGLFFFGFAPWYQFIENVTLWRLGSLDSMDYIRTSGIILIALFIFNTVYSRYRTSNTLNSPIVRNSFHSPLSIHLNKSVILIITSAIVTFFIIAKHKFNVYLLFFRGLADSMDVEVYASQVEGLIINNFIRPIPVIIFLFYIMYKNKNFIVVTILFFLVLISNAPTAFARLTAAAMYIPISLALIPFLRRKNNFTAALILGLLLVFPFLDNFRHFDADNKLSFNLNFNMMLEEHFDAYQNFLTIISDNIITYGRQLLGALLFFVPRSMWEDKPIGSGAFMATETGRDFTNISMPFIGEGYINFGIIGTILFSVLLAMFCKACDTRYWQNSNISLRFEVQYLIMCGMLFFILRGDLMNGIAYTSGMMTSVYVVSKLLKIK